MRIIYLIFLLISINISAQIQSVDFELLPDCLDYKGDSTSCVITGGDTIVVNNLLLGNFVNAPTTLEDVTFNFFIEDSVWISPPDAPHYLVDSTYAVEEILFLYSERAYYDVDGHFTFDVAGNNDTTQIHTAFDIGGGNYVHRTGFFDFGWELLQVTTDEGLPTIPPYLYGAYVDEDSDYVYLSDGELWYYSASFTKWGSGAPVTSPSGDDGQYLDVLSGDIYNNESLVWVLQPYRIKLFFGSGAPVASGNEEGDVYVDTLNEVTYTYDGATWVLDYFGVFIGNGAPSVLGQLDDVYIDMLNGDGYIHDGAQWVKTDKTN